MKRLLSLLLAIVFIFAFAGCENEKIVENPKQPTTENEPNTPITDENNDTLPSDDNQSSQGTGDNATTPSNNTNLQGVDDKTPLTQTDEFISKAKAKQIALSDAGVKESQIRDYEIESDREKGVYYYEINFEAGGFEYEYDIDAKSGKIVKKHKEKED